MIKLFVSQPMNGKTDEEILEERNRLINEVRRVYDNVEVIDSFFQDSPHDARPLWFLGKSLELLSTADLAVFANGWSEARGCIIEHECCLKYGIEIFNEDQKGIIHLITDYYNVRVAPY